MRVLLGKGSRQRLDETGDQKVIELLEPMITARRLAKINSVLEGRTYNLSVALDGLFDTGNMSAIMRSCDAFGIQRMNLVMTSARYKVGRKVSVGSHKWLDIHRYEAAEACALDLKAAGYRLLATHLDGAETIDAVDFSQRTALIFGNERDGVSDEMLAHCDGRIIIPMVGFSQSFNVSVAAAIAIYHATLDRTVRLGRSGDLTETEMAVLRERFFRRSVHSSDAVVSKVGLP